MDDYAEANMTSTLTPTRNHVEPAAPPTHEMRSAAAARALAALRPIGITFGGSALLNGFLAAGATAAAIGPLFLPGGAGTARSLRRLVGLGATAAWAYTLVARPWFLRWGAADADLDRPLPGDAIVPHAVWRSTRAITIAA